MGVVSDGPEKYRSAERQAKAARLRMWKNYTANASVVDEANKVTLLRDSTKDLLTLWSGSESHIGDLKFLSFDLVTCSCRSQNGMFFFFYYTTFFLFESKSLCEYNIG